MNKIAIHLPLDKINIFCKKWKVKELSLFGSVLREDFDSEKSDIDILIEFIPGVSWGWELANMKLELEHIFMRPVDIVSKRAIEKSRNPYRKKEILNTYQVVYEQTA